MRTLLRSLGATCLAVLSVIVLAVAWTTTAAVQLVATALIMGGTEHPLSTPEDPVEFINGYMQNAVDGFINPAAAAPAGTGNGPIPSVGPDDDRYAIITPEQFFPVFGSMTFDESVVVGLANLSKCVRGAADCLYNDNPQIDPTPPATPPVAGDEFVVFGYSQSAVIASLLKKDFIDNPDDAPDNVSFFLLANPMRPNGGFLSRGPMGLTIPILGVTFYGPTPTNSCEGDGPCYRTADMAGQYDGLGGDAAVGLTNVVAVLNAAMGYLLLHGELQNADFDNGLYQGSFGDTDYYLIPTPRLPLLMPFASFVPSPILTAIDLPLRTFIEGAYRRDINPGVPTGVGLLPLHDPLGTLLNVLIAVPTGIDDAIAEATNDPANRPLGTAPVTGPFGVGGPDLPEPPSESESESELELEMFSNRADSDEDTIEDDDDAFEKTLDMGREEDDPDSESESESGAVTTTDTSTTGTTTTTDTTDPTDTPTVDTNPTTDTTTSTTTGDTGQTAA
ncbi:PE-PPE domain-containing protein [Mycolicibacterium sp. XJ1819]